MAGVKGMYQGPKNVSWLDVERQYDWFRSFRPDIAKYGCTTGHIWTKGPRVIEVPQGSLEV